MLGHAFRLLDALLDPVRLRLAGPLLQPDDLPSMERERRLEGLGR